MKTSYMILSAASVIPLLSSCASHQQTADNKAWNIKPIYNVRHSVETPESYYQLGRYYQGQSRYEQALAAYQKALAIDGKFAEARNGMGVVYAIQGRQQEAIEQFRLAVEAAPNASHIHNNLGYALYLSKSYAEAVSVLDRAVALNPANKSANTNLALALDKAGNRTQAVQVMADAAKPQLTESVPAAIQQTKQAQDVHAPVAAASPAPAPQQVLALPKDWGVITQSAPSAESSHPVSKQPKESGPAVAQAMPQLAPKVESRVQLAQAKADGDEVRKQAEAHVQQVPITKPLQQASIRPKEAGAAVAQSILKLAPAAELHVQTSPQTSGVVEHQARSAAPAADPLQQVSVQPKERAKMAVQAVQKPVPATEPLVRTALQASATDHPVKVSAQAATAYRIEVANGNGVAGLAKKVAGFLHKDGDVKARLTNQKPFQVASSQVQYRTGYREQAQSLASALPGKPGITQTSNLRADISVRVLLGKDQADNVAYFEQHQDKVRLVRYGSDS
ncbi:MAG TPA: tetratricopeptide repeat protein [Gallionella sp.]|nr:tetratricopeptide repeat protein [Gallionella sp.]